MNWKGCKVLITGSEGFIGSHLTQRLVELGAQVRAHVLYNSFNSWGWLDTLEPATREKIEMFMGDVTNPYRTAQAVEGMDVVFHLAALIGIPYSYHAPEAYVATNVSGTLNVLQAARRYGVKKLVHTSTSEVYGSAIYAPIDENHPLQGQSPYSASKIGADMLSESFARSFEMPVAICRPFNTYGPRQSDRAVIPTIISQLFSGAKTLKLGTLDTRRDFNYVKDTVNGFVAIAESPDSVGQVINIGSGTEVTIGQVVEIICKLGGWKVQIQSESQRQRPEKSEVQRLLADNSKARTLLGWTPRYDLESGLKETLEWFRANAGLYKPGRYTI